MNDHDKAQLLTEYINLHYPTTTWTYAQSLHAVIDAKGYTEWTGGPNPGIKILGDTIFVDGKDITGNLGSKTTYGDYSPVVENNSGSFNNGPINKADGFWTGIGVAISGGLILLVISSFLQKTKLWKRLFGQHN